MPDQQSQETELKQTESEEDDDSEIEHAEIDEEIYEFEFPHESFEGFDEQEFDEFEGEIVCDEFRDVLSHVNLPSEYKDHPLNGLSYGQLVAYVDDLENQAKYLELENHIFSLFLQENAPEIIKDLKHGSEPADVIERNVSAIRRHTISDIKTSISSMRSKQRASSEASVMGSGFRINITHKIEMVNNFIMEMEHKLTNLRKKTILKVRVLTAEIEEVEIRKLEIINTFNNFETYIMNTEERTVPLEKFTRFFQGLLRTTVTTIDKLRLKNSALREHYNRLLYQYNQKKRMGENIQAVDFEQLQIENQYLNKKIEQNHNFLLDLKKINGECSLTLNNNKKILMNKVNELKNITSNIQEMEGEISKLNTDGDKVLDEYEKLKIKFNKIKQKTEEYQVPETIKYVAMKSKMNHLENKMKAWKRRKNLQKVEKRLLMLQLKKLSGSKTVLPKWFTEPKDEEIDEFFKFPFDDEPPDP